MSSTHIRKYLTITLRIISHANERNKDNARRILAKKNNRTSITSNIRKLSTSTKRLSHLEGKTENSSDEKELLHIVGTRTHSLRHSHTHTPYKPR